MMIADRSPAIRVASSGPTPMPRRCSSVAGVVMLFHSPMSRMNRTLPDAVDGEMEPKTASWRSHHGAMTRTNSPTQATAADHGIALPAPAIPQEREAQGGEDEQAVVPRQGRESGQEAGRREGTRRALEPAGTHPEGRQDERLVEGEVVGLDHVHDRHDGDRDEDAGTERDHARRAGIAGHRPGERCRQGADQGERQRRRPGRRAEHSR